MLDAIIRFSIRNRLAVMIFACLLVPAGWLAFQSLSIDVLPDVSRVSLTVMAEAGSLSAADVETQIARPIESALQGVRNVERIHSTSFSGVAIVRLDFSWSTDVLASRQLVQERLAQIQPRLPSGVTPVLAPLSSVMGEIQLIGLSDPNGNLAELRDAADFVVKPKLLAIRGVERVSVIGGEARRIQILADPERLARFGLPLSKLESAVQDAIRLPSSGSGRSVINGSNNELQVQSDTDIGVERLANTVVELREQTPILVRDVADVILGAPAARGIASANSKAAVILAIQKQPLADTREVTSNVEAAISAMSSSLPHGTIIDTNVFKQSRYIETSAQNVTQAIRDGAFLVAIVLFIFLLNGRTAAITLTALPLSLLSTAIVFWLFGFSANTMTLGGIALAIGELVDDAILDVENIFRRLNENSRREKPQPALSIIFNASSEVRNVIVISTIVVLLVCAPLFALSGIEGKLFRPLLAAYIISILMSLLISLTITPALSALLMKTAGSKGRNDSFALRICKTIAAKFYEFSFPRPATILIVLIGVTVVSASALTRIHREFLPPFDEGTLTITLAAPSGTSLSESDAIGARAEELMMKVPEVKSTARRTGRAEDDEHAESVTTSEIDVALWSPKDFPEASSRPAASKFRSLDKIKEDIREKLRLLPANSSIGQPLSHRIDHLLSGVQSQFVVNISGPDLGVLQSLSRHAADSLNEIPGTTDVQIQQQMFSPQLRLTTKPEVARLGFSNVSLRDDLNTLVSGKALGQINESGRIRKVELWSDAKCRANPTALENTVLISPAGALVRVRDVADCSETRAPAQIFHQNGARAIQVSCNFQERELAPGVEQAKRALAANITLPPGYTLAFAGQYEEQLRAMQLIFGLGLASLILIFVLLLSHFKSTLLAFQVMLNIPLAFIGGVAALLISRETLSLSALIGFVSLAGIASRNGVLMISHYLNVMRRDNLPAGRDLVIRASQERVAPVIMTALTTIFGMLPLIFSHAEPGKEILYPVAVVLSGGLITSTLLDFLVTPTIFLNYGSRAAVSAQQEIEVALTDQIQCKAEQETHA